MFEIRKNVYYRVLGPLAFCISLAVYLLTLSRGAYPGASAYSIVHFSGIQPRLSPDSPLFYLFARLVAMMGPSCYLSVRLNIFSALCGASTVWLLFQLVSQFVYASVEKNPLNRESAVHAALLAGLVSSATLAFSLPFWTVSQDFMLQHFIFLYYSL